jgi:hypothetical protein
VERKVVGVSLVKVKERWGNCAQARDVNGGEGRKIPQGDEDRGVGPRIEWGKWEREDGGEGAREDFAVAMLGRGDRGERQVPDGYGFSDGGEGDADALVCGLARAEGGDDDLGGPDGMPNAGLSLRAFGARRSDRVVTK